MTEYEMPQRATLVLEHISADDSWNLVAYLVRDSGERERVTLRRCASRAEAADALKARWDELTKR